MVHLRTVCVTSVLAHCTVIHSDSGDASKMSIIDKPIKLFNPASAYFNGVIVTFQARWFHRVFSDQTSRTAVAPPRPPSP